MFPILKRNDRPFNHTSISCTKDNVIPRSKNDELVSMFQSYFINVLKLSSMYHGAMGWDGWFPEPCFEGLYTDAISTLSLKPLRLLCCQYAIPHIQCINMHISTCSVMLSMVSKSNEVDIISFACAFNKNGEVL